MAITVTKAVIPAAGFGTRFLPATAAVPKEMLPVVDTPLIQFAVTEAAASGITDIAIVTREGKTAIEDHFLGHPDLARHLRARNREDLLEEVRKIEGLARYHFIDQPDAAGLGDAVLRAEGFAAGDPVAVLVPDDIFVGPTPCLRQLLDVFAARNGPVVALERTGVEGTRRSAIVRARSAAERIYEIQDVEEKPGPERAPSDLAIVGRYILTPEAFDVLRRTQPGGDGEIRMAEALRRLCRRGKVYGVAFEGVRYGAEDKAGYVEAVIETALERPDLRDKVMEIIERHRR